jgi:hypothetical protein
VELLLLRLPWMTRRSRLMELLCLPLLLACCWALRLLGSRCCMAAPLWLSAQLL